MAVTATEAGPDTWNVSTTPRTQSVTVAAGDYVVVYGVTADQTASLNTPTGGGLTYTLIGAVNVGSSCYVAAWWALSASSQTFTISGSRSATSVVWGYDAIVVSGSSGLGASNTAQSTGGASVTFTPQAANSAVFVAVGDWNAADGTSRTWRTNGGTLTELTYFRDSAQYTVYGGVHLDAGTATSKAFGLSAPTGMKYSVIAFEMKASGGGATPISGSDTAALTETAAVVVTMTVTDTGTLTQAATGTATATGTDTATTSDAAGITTIAAGSDSAALAESVPSIAVAGTDGASLADALAIAATLATSDTATAADQASLDTGGTAKSGSDTATTVDNGAVTATASTADNGALTDTAGATATMAAADAATVTDAITVLATLGSADTGSVVSASSLGVQPAGTDAAALAETATIVVALATGDTIALSETQAVGGGGPNRDIEITYGRPTTGWSTGPATSSWSTGRATSTWTTGRAEV